MTYVDRRKNNPLPQWQQPKTGDAMSRLEELMAQLEASRRKFDKGNATYDDYQSEVERALRYALEPQKWQLIETAPKDGRTLLLGYFNKLGKWRTLRGQWMSSAYIAENWEEPDDGVEGWHETSVEADEAPNCWHTHPP